MDVDAMSKQTRRAMVEAIDVSTAACALTFAGDIIIEADEETIFLANQKGASVQYAGANLNMSIRSEEHTSELQSLMRISYAVLCLQQQKLISKRHPTPLYSTIYITKP